MCLFKVNSCHDLLDPVEERLLGHINESFDVTAKGYFLDALDSALTDINILFCIYQLPAHPCYHWGVVRAISRSWICQGYVILHSNFTDKSSQLWVAGDSTCYVDCVEGNLTRVQPSQGKLQLVSAGSKDRILDWSRIAQKLLERQVFHGTLVDWHITLLWGLVEL